MKPEYKNYNHYDMGLPSEKEIRLILHTVDFTFYTNHPKWWKRLLGAKATTATTLTVGVIIESGAFCINDVIITSTDHRFLVVNKSENAALLVLHVPGKHSGRIDLGSVIDGVVLCSAFGG